MKLDFYSFYRNIIMMLLLSQIKRFHLLLFIDYTWFLRILVITLMVIQVLMNVMTINYYDNYNDNTSKTPNTRSSELEKSKVINKFITSLVLN